MDLAHDSGDLGRHRDLHLHRLEDHDLVALGDQLTLIDDDLPDVCGDLRSDLVHGAERSGERGGDPRTVPCLAARRWIPFLTMWLLVLTVAIAAIVVIVTRGSWERLFHLPIKGSLFFFAGLFIQIALEYIDFAPDRIETTGYGLLMLSYVFLLTFCLINLPLRGMGVIAIGIALNVIVIGLNQGMPTRAVGLDAEGNQIEKPIEQSVKHRPASDEDLLGFLGDEILLPRPFDTLISIGDIVLAIGICELAYFGSRTRRRRQRASRTPRRTSTRSSAPSTRPS